MSFMKMTLRIVVGVFIGFSPMLSALAAIVFNDTNLYEGSACKLSDGTDGICSTECVTNQKVQENTNNCGYKRRDVVACCPAAPKYPTIEGLCLKRKEEEENKRRLRERQEEQCKKIGVCTTTSRFLGEQNENPHMAVLGWRAEGQNFDWKCGGSLIHPSYILTAAHCIKPAGKPDVVRLGAINLQDDEYNTFVRDFNVTDAFVHPNYEETLYYHDVAILKIVLQTSSYTPPPLVACLWPKREFPQDSLRTMGYGAHAFGMLYTYKLYQSDLIVIETANCSHHYERTISLPQGLIDSIICAHDPQQMVDTCEGDSGGPLQYIEEDWMRTPYIVGIVSFGTICLSGVPGAYTRVHSYLGWIEGVISQDESVGDTKS